MADVKWIKITTDMFDNRKIRHLRRLPDGNNIVLIWVMLLTMAGRCNSSGMIFLTENIPYTPKMLADELDFEESTVQLALRALEELNMIVSNDGYFTIAGWEEYQNTDRLAEIREYNRLAKQKSRAKKKLLNAVNDKSMTSQRGHDTDIEEDKEKERDKDETDKIDKNDKIDKSVPLHTPNALTKELIKADYISECDIYIDEYNAILQELTEQYSFEIVRSCLWYFIKRYKSQPTDEDGKEIENKVAYFRTAVSCGADRLDRENNRSFEGFGSFLYN